MCMRPELRDPTDEQLAWQLYEEYGIRPRELLSQVKKADLPVYERAPRKVSILTLLHLH
jgi:hypothetical protein